MSTTEVPVVLTRAAAYHFSGANPMQEKASMARIGTRLEALRARVLPPHVDELGWAPLWNLFYLGFLFFSWGGDTGRVWLLATLLSVAIFLPVYFRAYGQTGARVIAHAAVIAALGFALAPFNSCANTYLIYAGAVLPFSGVALPRMIAMIAAGLALYAVELSFLPWPPRYTFMVLALTALIVTTVCAANYFQREKRLRQAELILSHDEVRRLAALAERERIGRDLHDILGHSLTAIAVKAAWRAGWSSGSPAMRSERSPRWNFWLGRRLLMSGPPHPGIERSRSEPR